MKKHILSIAIITLSLMPLSGQPAGEYLGLAGKSITSMSMYGEIVAVGTEGNGVYYLNTFNLPDTNWTLIGLENEHVSAIYPHKAGPVGWGITAGVIPAEGDSIYVYCNHMGGEFFANSAGITDTIAFGVYSLAGFPDPTICGEKYAATGRALYRQGFSDTTWEALLTLNDAESAIITVETKEDVGGIVLVGGFAGTTGILLMKSLNFGETWDHLYPSYPVMALEFSVNSTYDDIEYVFVTDGEIISRSLDGGGDWEAVFTLEYVHTFRTILYDAYTGYLFVAGSAGGDDTGHLLYSKDLGDNWHGIPVDTLDTIVDIAFSGDGYLYVAARNSGIFKLFTHTLEAQALDHHPVSFSLEAPYPNPFNAVTTLRYELPMATQVELAIYDILGKAVSRLSIGTREAGYHRLQWEALDARGQELPSGIYIARLVTPEYSRSVKLVLLK